MSNQTQWLKDFMACTNENCSACFTEDGQFKEFSSVECMTLHDLKKCPNKGVKA